MTDRSEPIAPDQGLGTPAPVPSPGETSVATTPERPSRPSLTRQAVSFTRGLLLPALAIFTALLVGALVIVLSDQEIVGLFGRDPVAALGASWEAVARAYGALIT